MIRFIIYQIAIHKNGDGFVLSAVPDLMTDLVNCNAYNICYVMFNVGNFFFGFI